MKVLTLVFWLVIVFLIYFCEKSEQRRRPYALLGRKSQSKGKQEAQKINETKSLPEDFHATDGAQERKDDDAESKAEIGNSLGNSDYSESFSAHSGTDLDPSMFHGNQDAYNTYMNMLNHYNNYQSKNGTENKLLKAILKKLLFGVPVFFGYYRVFSYLNEICASGATCSNVTVTTSVTSTKKKSTSMTETTVLTSMKTKTATRTIPETLTTTTTPVRTTTLPATSTTYRTNIRTLRSTITTTTTTVTKKTSTFKFSETTTSYKYIIKSKDTTFTLAVRKDLMELFEFGGDTETIEISPTAGVEITSTYAWSKFSAVMSSLETTTDSEDDVEWTTQEPMTPEYDRQDLNQRKLFMPLEGSKLFIVETSSVSYDDY